MTAHANIAERLPLKARSTQDVGSDVARYFSTHEMLSEVSRLAKRAEWWGAPPQGRNVALFAECLAEGNHLSAMETRDEILAALVHARSEAHWGYFGIASLIVVVGAPFLLFALPFFLR